MRAVTWMSIICLTGVLALMQMGILAKPVGVLARLDVSWIVIDMASGKYRVCPAIAKSADGEDFGSMVQRLKPYAAICGTYYDPAHKPLGDIVINGKRVYKGSQRQGIGFLSDGRIKFLERHGRQRIDWTGCVSGIACGPRLLRAGHIDVNAKRDGFSAAAEARKAWRCAVGATKRGKLIMCVVSEPVTLDTLAEAMRELGAVDAINLDGGSMCAFYENGKYRAQPMLPMSNILAVYKVK